MSLFLIRHAQTAWNLEKRAQGSVDTDLDDTGVQQTWRLMDALSHVSVKQILSSDLQRSIQTAAPLSNNLRMSLELDGRLRERSFGEWEGLHFDEIGRNFDAAMFEQGIAREAIAPPGGESFVQVWDRLLPISAQLLELQSAIVVTHGGICSVLLAQLLSGTVALSGAFKFHNASVTELEPKDAMSFRLVGYNDIRHLAGLKVAAGVADGTSH